MTKNRNYECAVGGIRHPQHTQTSSNYSMIAADNNYGMTNTRGCTYSCLCSWRWVMVPPKEQFPDKLCKVASRWIYSRIIVTMHGPMKVKLILILDTQMFAAY